MRFRASVTTSPMVPHPNAIFSVLEMGGRTPFAQR